MLRLHFGIYPKESFGEKRKRLDFQEERAISLWAQISREVFWSSGAEIEDKKGAFPDEKRGTHFQNDC